MFLSMEALRVPSWSYWVRHAVVTYQVTGSGPCLNGKENELTSTAVTFGAFLLLCSVCGALFLDCLCLHGNTKRGARPACTSMRTTTGRGGRAGQRVERGREGERCVGGWGEWGLGHPCSCGGCGGVGHAQSRYNI